jgi:hypothetical protein
VNLSDVRDQFVAVVRAYDPDLNVYALPEPEPQTPCVMLDWPDEIDYHDVVLRAERLMWRAALLVPAAELTEAAAMADRYVSGPASLVVALEAPAARGVWSNLTVVRAAGWVRVDELDALLVELELVIS